MDPATFLALTVSCAPLVHPETSHALVAVESGFNPHAIGVVNGALFRQPRSPGEAITTARSLQAQGWNFSVGLAQINLHNFAWLGLSLDTAFDPCENLRAMQKVLLDCFDRAGPARPAQPAIRKALSCYYSGNFETGFRHGYVQRVAAVATKRAAASSRPP